MDGEQAIRIEDGRQTTDDGQPMTDERRRTTDDRKRKALRSNLFIIEMPSRCHPERLAKGLLETFIETLRPEAGLRVTKVVFYLALIHNRIILSVSKITYFNSHGGSL